MILFIDASALVSIIALEPGYRDFKTQLDSADELITSPIACWEAVRALQSSYEFDHRAAEVDLNSLLESNGIRLVPIGSREAEFALQAHRDFGKGNHLARLNMGDCFAYACAKANGAKMLYKGDDFSKTDLA